MNEQIRKKLVQRIFNSVADQGGREAMPFFHRAAEYLPKLFEFKGTEQVLDVATGTGIAARFIAPLISEGKLTGIDYSESMLDRARHVLRPFGNIRLQAMDMQEMRFEDGSFDAANCFFGIFAVDDMEHLIKHIASKVKPGGQIVTCSFSNDAFWPNVELFSNRLKKYGVDPEPIQWKRISTEDQFRSLYQSAQLENVQFHLRDVSYHLVSASEWWDIIWHAGFKDPLNKLDARKLAAFKADHLREIDLLKTKEGIPLSVQVLFAVARR